MAAGRRHAPRPRPAPTPLTPRSESRFSRENRCDRQPDIGMRAELGSAGIAVIGATAHARSPLGGSPRKELPGHLRHHSRVHAARSRHPRVGCRCAGLGLFCLQTGNDAVSRCSGSQLALARSPGPPATLGRRSTGSKVIRWRRKLLFISRGTSSRGHPLDAEGRPKVTARLFSRTHAARSSSE
jgi:hypothetical protein